MKEDKLAELRPKKIQRVLRYLILVPMLALAAYGMMRFSLVSVPPDYGWQEYRTGEKLIVDTYYNHGRGLAPDDMVLFVQAQDGRERTVLGRVLALPGAGEAPDIHGLLRSRIPNYLPPSFGAETAKRLARGAGAPPSDDACLVVVVLSKAGQDRLFLDWVAMDRITGRVLMRSPF